MITIITPTSPSRVRLVAALGLLAAACVTEATPAPVEPEPVVASAAASPPIAAPTPAMVAPEPEPPPAPAAPNAEPATLRLAMHGRCQYLGSSDVDGQTFVHYRHDEHGFVHRMDEHGAVAQTLPYDAPDEYYGEGPREIVSVGGHWPGLFVLRETFHQRADDYTRLHRWTDAGWQPIGDVHTLTSYEGAWPWRDGSLLAWAQIERDIKGSWRRLDRLAVVRGKPKAPPLAKLQARASCSELDFTLIDVAVRGDDVVVLASCNKREGGAWSSDAWIGTWKGGATAWTVTRLSKWPDPRQLHLDDHGEGFITAVGSTEPILLRWSGGKVHAIALPSPTLDAVIQAGDGRAWIVQGSTLSRFTGEGWETVPTPEGPAIVQAAGLEHGTPWLLRRGGALSMQTADGAWHDVTVPPVPDLESLPTIDGVRVVAPGDAWVQAEYHVTLPPKKPGKRGKPKTMRALYTTRDAPVPLQCGAEANAGAPPSE